MGGGGGGGIDSAWSILVTLLFKQGDITCQFPQPNKVDKIVQH